MALSKTTELLNTRSREGLGDLGVSSTNSPYDMNAPSIKSRLRKGSFFCLHSFIERAIVRTKTMKSKTRRVEKPIPSTDRARYQYTVLLHGTYTYNEPL
jgi:hypothetical protein